jgi:hypothetical protein
MKVSRPFRFLMLVFGVWTGMRVTDVWRREGIEQRSRVALRIEDRRHVAHPPHKDSPLAKAVAPQRATPSIASRASDDPEPHVDARHFPAAGVAIRREVGTSGPAVRAAAEPAFAAPPPPLPEPPFAPHATIVPVARLADVALPSPAGARLAGSGWLIVRGGGTPRVPASQIGGSQAGLRLTFPVDDRRRVALSMRASVPLAGRGSELAVGFDWQPARLPLHVLAEQRLAIDGGTSAPMLGVVGGFGPAAGAHHLDLEGYGQAGFVARRDGGGFVDGALRATQPLGTIHGVPVDAGAGLWGGMQRGAGRLDLGPTIGLALPLTPRIRLTADWRQRIAGRSRPGSGPALSLGTGW